MQACLLQISENVADSKYCRTGTNKNATLASHSGVAGDVTTFRLAHISWRFEGTKSTLSLTHLTLKMDVLQAFETPVLFRQST